MLITNKLGFVCRFRYLDHVCYTFFGLSLYEVRNSSGSTPTL